VRAQSVGTLRVEVSLSGLYGRVGSMALGILLTELVRSAALALVLLVGVRQLVLRPLQQVSSYAGELSLDQLDQPLRLERPRHDGPDEIDVLAGAIDDMRASLREQVETREAMERQTQQLEVEKEAAELASAAKGEFLANVSHEIRTPMNAIIGMADLALHSGLAEPQRGYIQRVRSSADLLMGILNDILDFSKIEAGKLDIDTVDFDLDDVVRSVSEIVGVRAREQSLILSTEVATDVPPRLRGDPLRLQQVLLNLMGNAVKFTARGRVALHVESVASTDEGLRLRFTVQDTGLGMTADQMSRLFQPFTQADASTSRRFGGTGLGLAISRQLVERMGGRIDVASEPGQGSTFWVELPFGVVASASAALPTATVTRLMSLPGAADHPELAGLHVLLVEDNEVNQELAVALLERVGIQVTLAGDGRQALSCLKAGSFDCVLMDCQMPEMDGYTATRLMREQPEWARLPVIAMTANAMAGERDKVLEAGMNDHVPKPVPVGELYRKLAVWTGRSQAGGAQGVAAVR
jgi:signal transduction histidine kinase/ActR/RegA family two-component response regulator